MNSSEHLIAMLRTSDVTIRHNGETVVIDRLFRTGQAAHFSGYSLTGGPDVKIVVPQSEINNPTFDIV